MSVTIESRIVSDVVILDVAGKFDVGEDSLKTFLAEGGQHFLLESGRCSLPRQLGYHPNHLVVEGDSQHARDDGIACAGERSPGRTPVYKARYRLCDL